ncbi:M23 family metallopeptidase [Flavobacterium sp.]|uniref:M23 family metallopeptidase n=1 Tax=Flavobacterium sp. TaxID=239 RepID=UPI0031D01086
MPDLGIYKIKVASKDQYGLNKEFKTSVIKNEVISIGAVGKSSGSNIFLSGIANSELTLEAKTFKINPPTDDEKEDVRWMIYDSSGKPYLTSGTDLFIDKKDSQRNYIHKWKEFTMTLPQKAGHYTVEAFSDRQKGGKSGAIFKIEIKQPEITEAWWAWSGGSKKTSSGFSGESNYITALIPHYENQKVRVYFYLNDAKTNHHIDIETNSKGEIFEEVKFDEAFQKAIGLGSKRNVKIGFKLLGIQNSKPYPFKSPANYDANTTLSLTTDKKVLDVYFTYDGVRVNPLTPVPYGAKVKGIVKTLNMVGSEVVLKVRRKNAQHSQLKMKTIVKSEGEASISFVLDKKWRPITPLFGTEDSYYLGMEGVESRLYLENGLNAVVGDFNNIANKKQIINENDPQLIWGAKVSKDFRIKVVQICKELWPNNILEMANGLMAVMNRETAGTFAPHQIEGKKLIPKDQVTKDSFNKYKDGKRLSRAVGLVQFTQSALSQMGEYKGGGFDELHELKLQYANMTQLDQLNKVKKYIESVKTLPKIPEDIYIAVFAPAFVGNDLNETMYELGTTNYNENASLDVDKKKNGIQMRELITEYYSSLHDGEYGRNIWRNPLDKMELRGWYSTWRPEDSNHGVVPTRSSGKHDGLDLYAPVGTPIFACVDGMRVRVGPDVSDSYGKTITIRGFYEGKEYHFFYAHLSEVNLNVGEKVKAGMKIGKSGKTGNAKNLLAKQEHLHFEVRKSNASQGAGIHPLESILELKNVVNLNPDREKQK